MPNSTTYVLMIRHGENDWVGTDRLAGRTPGVHLNEKGRKQAADLAELLNSQPIAAVYSSPLERCMETATPVAAALGLAVQPEPGVMEVDYGEWQGQSLKDLSKLPDWQMVQHFPSTYRFPGGETLRETQARAVGTIERLHEQHPNQVIAVFSHGDIIRTTVAHFMGTPIDLFQRVIISTASVSVLALHDRRPMVLCANYVSALPTLSIKVEEKATEDEQ
jgi:probable phosphomutase (TIGR03848 family)